MCTISTGFTDKCKKLNLGCYGEYQYNFKTTFFWLNGVVLMHEPLYI